MSIITCRSHQTRDLSHQRIRASTDTLYHYIGGTSGAWQVTSMSTYAGPPLLSVTHVEIANGKLDRTPAGTAWALHGVVQNTRFVTREETPQMRGEISDTSQSDACAALILIQRSPDWWDLSLNDRSELVEPPHTSRKRLGFLPSILRFIPQRNDVDASFDSVTWFEYLPHDAAIFDDLATAMRSLPESKYVDREIIIKLAVNANYDPGTTLAFEPRRRH